MRLKLMLIMSTILLNTAVYGGEKMKNQEKATIAVTITIKAKKGKSDELSNLLSGASEIVQSTEPGTLFWYATKVNEDTFTINDGFSSELALQAHFNGKVAAALKSKASELVQGGWEQGVLPNIVRADILSIID